VVRSQLALFRQQLQRAQAAAAVDRLENIAAARRAQQQRLADVLALQRGGQLGHVRLGAAPGVDGRVIVNSAQRNKIKPAAGLVNHGRDSL
jgi:hypothetical protein